VVTFVVTSSRALRGWEARFSGFPPATPECPSLWWVDEGEKVGSS
jgi:hypothetical protein